VRVRVCACVHLCACCVVCDVYLFVSVCV